MRLEFKSLQLKMVCSRQYKLVCLTALLQTVEQLLRHKRVPQYLSGRTCPGVLQQIVKGGSPCVGERLAVLIRSWGTTKNMWGLNKFGAIRLLIKKEISQVATSHLLLISSFFFLLLIFLEHTDLQYHYICWQETGSHKVSNVWNK